MSAKIAVLEAGQSTSDQPTSHVKKSVANLLVRRLQAERLGHKLIRLLPNAGVVITSPLPPERQKPTWKPYIPEQLPHVELPGLVFRATEGDSNVLAMRRGLIARANIFARAAGAGL